MIQKKMCVYGEAAIDKQMSKMLIWIKSKHVFVLLCILFVIMEIY